MSQHLYFLNSMRSFIPNASLLRRSNSKFSAKLIRILTLFLAVWLMWPGSGWAQTAAPRSSDNMRPYLDRVAKQVTEFTLSNGMKFIVLERHQAPVVSFLTYADVGGADEPEGKTGVAHFLEHLAFKGTQRIGSKDYAAEKRLLDRLDVLFDQIRAAQAQGDAAKVQQLQTAFNKAQAAADQLVEQNKLGQIVNQSGGVGLNATTSADATKYFYSFPSNKLELWMSLESERFLEPVFREFYKEREVILEERRMRTDNSPIGKMMEFFLGKAFITHPYLRPVIGYPEDLRNLTRQDVQSFYEKYYGPNNLTMVLVGDIYPTDVKRLAQIYFGRYPAKVRPPTVAAVEPVQQAERSVTVKLETQPWYFEGFHRPGIKHPDNVVYDLLASLMSDGRTARLYKSLVEQQRIALAVQGFNGYPGDKFPNLILFYALTAPGHGVDEVAQSLGREIQRLKTEPVSIQDLDRVKTRAKASILRSLDSNSGLAKLLGEYEVKTGTWRNLFKEINAIAAVTPADVQRVAKTTFVPTNRTVGRLLPLDNPAKPAG
jgi:predicted Zn-dependent peptidase